MNPTDRASETVKRPKCDEVSLGNGRALGIAVSELDRDLEMAEGKIAGIERWIRRRASREMSPLDPGDDESRPAAARAEPCCDCESLRRRGVTHICAACWAKANRNLAPPPAAPNPAGLPEVCAYGAGERCGVCPACRPSPASKPAASEPWAARCEPRAAHTAIVLPGYGAWLMRLASDGITLRDSINAREQHHAAELARVRAEAQREVERAEAKASAYFTGEGVALKTLRTAERDRDEARAELEKFTGASANKTDWCPCCRQGWGIAKDYGDRIRAANAEMRTARADRDEARANLKRLCADVSEGFECLPSCTIDDHAEDCPVANSAAAVRQLRADRDALAEKCRGMEARLVRAHHACCRALDIIKINTAPDDTVNTRAELRAVINENATDPTASPPSPPSAPEKPQAERSDEYKSGYADGVSDMRSDGVRMMSVATSAEYRQGYHMGRMDEYPKTLRYQREHPQPEPGAGVTAESVAADMWERHGTELSCCSPMDFEKFGVLCIREYLRRTPTLTEAEISERAEAWFAERNSRFDGIEGMNTAREAAVYFALSLHSPAASGEGK